MKQKRGCASRRMDIIATELFWKLVTDKAGIKPATEPQVFTQTFTPLEATWEKFRTVKGTEMFVWTFITCTHAHMHTCTHAHMHAY